MSRLNALTSEYIGRISVSVWIGRLTDEAAREALRAYAAACQRIEQAPGGSAAEAVLAEYRRRRDGQDLCS